MFNLIKVALDVDIFVSLFKAAKSVLKLLPYLHKPNEIKLRKLLR